MVLLSRLRQPSPSARARTAPAARPHTPGHSRPARALGAVIALCTLLLASPGCDRGSHPDRLDRVAPPFTISDGVSSLDLAKFRGRVVVLNLWASWCAPCVDELPSLLELHRQLPQLAIIGVSIDQDDTAYRRFLQEYRVDFPNVRDPDGRINALYGTIKIPETYIIDRDGRLRRKFIDAQNWTSPEIVRYLRQL